MMLQSRIAAGRQLARALSCYRGENVAVLALSKGGVVVGAEVAKHLRAPLELIVASKIGHPMASMYTIGAVTETGVPVWNQSELGFTTEAWRQRQVERARRASHRARVRLQSGGRIPSIRGKVVIVVGEGTATGLAMIAALRDLIKRQPKSIIVALPVASAEAAKKFLNYANEVMVLGIPRSFFGSVSAYYEALPEVSDEEVRGLLHEYRETSGAGPFDYVALNAVLSTITQYPATSRQLANEAHRLHAPDSVVKFFNSMPRGSSFEDKPDVMRRSLETSVLMQEEVRQPAEALLSYGV